MFLAKNISAVFFLECRRQNVFFFLIFSDEYFEASNQHDHASLIVPLKDKNRKRNIRFSIVDRLIYIFFISSLLTGLDKIVWNTPISKTLIFNSAINVLFLFCIEHILPTGDGHLPQCHNVRNKCCWFFSLRSQTCSVVCAQILTYVQWQNIFNLY